MSSNFVTITLYVNNMTCPNCENSIESVLSNMTGVNRVKASYIGGTVCVTYDEALVELEKIEKVIKKQGYNVQRQQVRKKDKEERKADRVGLSNIAGMAIIIIFLYIILKRFGLTHIFYSFPVAKEGMGYGLLFLIGLLTSIHCVAMCGGIALSQCVPKDSEEGMGSKKMATIRPSLLYNLGRVISYTVIGGMIGALGAVISFSGTMKGLVQIIAGIFMVIMGVNMLNIFPWLRKFNLRMPKTFAKRIYAKKNNNSPIYIGLLNGFMPCGPLQAMQLYALSAGSPVKGALSMFFFSAGTIPLMFAFGALSSYLSKKYTHKMMTASGVLVVFLGAFMLTSGASLSGINLSQFTSKPYNIADSSGVGIAVVKDGAQTVTSGMSYGQFESIVVQKGVPLKWIIQAENGDINGCNNSIVIPAYRIEKDLVEGNNVIEFTPNESGIIPFSCWMGMIRSQITVVDDINSIGNSNMEN